MANKLELDWAGKHDGYALIRDEETGKPVQVPYDEVQPRLLVEDGRYGDETADNILISGENLYALKTLVKSGYAGEIKCIYIDPPYNTGNAFTHYDDALEHSLWLTMMRDRLDLLKDLLAEDGSLWISIDDNEMPHLRILLDETFGRDNFIATIIWQKIYTVKNSARHFSDMHDYIVIYAKNSDKWQRNLLPRSNELNESYSNPDNDLRGDWTTNAIQARNYYSQGTYEITSPNGEKFSPPKGTYWRVSKETFEELARDNRIWWGRNGNSVPRIKKFLSEVKQGVVPATLWLHTEAGQNAEAKTEVREIFTDSADVFLTPKPERLMKRICEIATNEGDIVLDCFAGSGTTGAVALKMNRRFIMVEAGHHCETHIMPRLRKVIEGTDKGGISPLVPPHSSRANADTNLIGETKQQLGWTGGGGFRYYTLGKSLLERDTETGVWRLNYTNGHLIEAVCLQEGFKLVGRGNYHGLRGRHYAHIADTIVTQEYVDALAAELAEDESLTIYCMKAKRKLITPDGVELKRIPRDLLSAYPVKSVRQAEVATA
jgi:adenine-specific DNA-methyltransferase